MSELMLPSYNDLISSGQAGYGEPGAWVAMRGPLSLATPYGLLTPMYEPSTRRPRVMPLLFHPDGSLKSLPLQEKTLIKTPAGDIWAELVSFYPSGALRRVFPVDGEIDSAWTEADEMNQVEEASLTTPIGVITRKFLSLFFYESGSLKSLAFWPQEVFNLKLGTQELEARYGLAFYEHGPLRRLEPAKPVALPTPIGTLHAFDPYAIGVHGDTGSLELSDTGEVMELITVSDSIEIKGPNLNTVIRPKLRRSYCNIEEMEPEPLRVRFDSSDVEFLRGNFSLSCRMESASFKCARQPDFASSFTAMCGC